MPISHHTDLDADVFAARAATLVRKHFDSPREYADWIEQNTTSAHGYRARQARNGINLLRHGDESLIARAHTFMQRLSTQLPTLDAIWSLDMTGAFPCVPAAIAGVPETMWNRHTTPSDAAPVRIFVNVLPSGGCSSDQLLERGAVLSALCMLLAERRSFVRVTAYADQPASDGRGVVLSWDLPTAPVNLAHYCASLGQPDLVQATSLYSAAILNPTINYGWLRGHCPGYGYDEAQCRADLGASEDDVILPALFSRDACINKPVEWLAAELERIIGSQGSGW